VFKRCGKCSKRVVAKRCECGYDKASWTWIADIHAKGQERKSKMAGGFKTRAEAVAGMAAELAKRDAGTFIEPSKLTVREYLAGWLDTVQPPTIRGSTFVSYRHSARVVSDRIGDMLLQQVTRQTIRALYASLAAEGNKRSGGGLSSKTVHNLHLSLHRALAAAVEDGLIATNPADRGHKVTGDRPEMQVWTADQVVTFLAAVRGDRLYGLWRLLVATGLRRGEALGLRWADVALDATTLRVTRQLVRGPGGLAWGSPKTAKGRRLIALDATTLAELRRHRARQAEERLAWGPDYRDGDLVFSRENGSPLDPDSVTGAFERHVRRLGLPRLTLHGLRHTHATLGLSAGVHVKVMSERLGHSTVAMTLDVYSHVIPAMQADAADRIAALIEAAG